MSCVLWGRGCVRGPSGGRRLFFLVLSQARRSILGGPFAGGEREGQGDAEAWRQVDASEEQRQTGEGKGKEKEAGAWRHGGDHAGE